MWLQQRNNFKRKVILVSNKIWLDYEIKIDC